MNENVEASARVPPLIVNLSPTYIRYNAREGGIKFFFMSAAKSKRGMAHSVTDEKLADF
jgi:hypothetical protein